MNTINQLILDCLARVLRINQTTDADVSFEFVGNVKAVLCFGHKFGYAEAVKEQGEKPDPNFCPLPSCIGSAYGNIYIGDDGAEEKLCALLASLDTLEKELMANA